MPENNMQGKTCFILNFGPHYRLPIYKKIAEAYAPDFYIGDRGGDILKTFNYEELSGYKRTVKRHNIFYGFYWLGGSVNPIFKNFDRYVMTGEPMCLSNWVILLLAKLFGKETISWTHGWYGREHGIKKWIKRIYFRLHTKCMCYNEYGARLLIEQGIKPENVCVIYNSLDSDKQRQIRNRLTPTEIYRSHFNNDKPVIIYCGRIQRSKKLNLLIEAVARLKSEGIDVNAVLVGKDIEGTDMATIAERLGVQDRVWFYGPCYEEERLGELFYNATMCVSPGNVGLTAIHSLTYGCPVITHDDFPNQGPEFETIRPGITGDFFKEDSVESLTEKIKNWLNMTLAERERVRQQAFQEVDGKWNIQNQISVLKNIL